MTLRQLVAEIAEFYLIPNDAFTLEKSGAIARRARMLFATIGYQLGFTSKNMCSYLSIAPSGIMYLHANAKQDQNVQNDSKLFMERIIAKRMV